MSQIRPRRITPPDDVIDRIFATRHPYAFLILLCLVLWLPGFFTLPPADRDESRFAEASKQMIESGDYVQIRNGDTARNQKPIGIYWMQAPSAAAARALGLARLDDIWPYRLPSLAGGIAAVLGTCWLGQKMFARRVAVLGAAMLAASMVLATETHIAKTDAALLAATIAVMGLLSRAYLAPASFSRWQAWSLWLALGVAILLKGPVTPMIAALTIATLAIADRRAQPSRAQPSQAQPSQAQPSHATASQATAWQTQTSQPGPPRWLAALRPLQGMLLMLVVILPWFIAIGIATHGRFFDQSLGTDLGNKLAGGDEAHGALPGFHILLLAMTLFPASFVVFPGLAAAWRRRREPALRFLLAWTIPAWLVFEAVPTKLPHYTMPLLPAICLLGALWALDPPAGQFRQLRRLSLTLFGVAAALFGLAAAILPKVVQPGWHFSTFLGVPALAAASVIAWLVLRAGEPGRAARLAVLSAPLFTWAFLGFELPHLQAVWLAPRIVAALEGHAIPPGGFAAAGYAEPSLVFLHGADTRLVANGIDGARFLSGAAGRVVAVARRDLPGFLAEAQSLQITPRQFGEVDGYNYSHGRRVEMLLFDR